MEEKKLNLECTQEGFANGVAPGFPLTKAEKSTMIEEATEAYGKFLDALKCDWRNDPNSNDTPRRVAKAYVNDLWAGRYTAMSPITSFPSDGYDGIVIERNIPLTSNVFTSPPNNWRSSSHWLHYIRKRISCRFK
jgi:GTP cyclohydrolase IA